MAIVTPTGAGNVTTTSDVAANTITVGKPASTASGDLLMCAVFFRDALNTITSPAGWTRIGPLNQTNETFALYYKPIPSAAGESATTYTFTASGAAFRTMAICFRVTGANLSAVVDATGTLAAYTQYSSCSLPSVTAVSAYSLLVAVAITNNSSPGAPSTYTSPVGMTEIGETSVDNGLATSDLWVGSEVRGSSGATGARAPSIGPTALDSGGFMVTVTGIPDVPPATVVHPDAVISATGFVASSGAVLTAVGDESDATYAESVPLTATNAMFSVSLGPLSPAARGLVVEFRARLDVAASTFVSIGLYQGTTLIKMWAGSVTLTTTLTTFQMTASAADVTPITDWSNLTLTCLARV